MTDGEWLACADPKDALRDTELMSFFEARKRKWRLFIFLDGGGVLTGSVRHSLPIDRWRLNSRSHSFV